MPSFTSVMAIAGLASMALATPLDLGKRATPEKFSIPQIKSGKSKFKSGPIALANVYKKFSKTTPSNVAAAAAAAVTGAVTTTPGQYDEEYTCPVLVGSTTLEMDFDTGSADL
jgi:hypothetical protein